MKVNFIVVGGQKCGTTAVHKFMKHHPQVKTSNPKETDFFNYRHVYEKGFNYYHSHFGKDNSLKRSIKDWYRNVKFMESSPTYLTDEDITETAKRIYTYNPKIKLICLVRNPTDRAFSAWNMYRKRYFEKGDEWWFEWMKNKTGRKPLAISRTKKEYQDFNLYVENELAVINKNQKIACDIIKMGEYYKGIKIFQRFFGDNFLVIKNEDLKKNTSEKLIEIAEFFKIQSFDWERFHNVEIFKGNYIETMPVETEKMLNSLYSNANEELFKLTGISY
ncbi:Sulfotransferase domain-containing protein [Salinimicrobium sediminis]|uniref:Sulfotransferase domain-containing protein n=1 Tax=Salinimicrobium sediminis TaxID=1343891 RepID=A0A285X1H5_9FLAO|nr:sulfotransferase domain-containing protein [Salinimicrobium sediminis]SOC78584.1 Sulfotransferase domain-containing protein [Salinimicrobium sediminis]